MGPTRHGPEDRAGDDLVDDDRAGRNWPGAKVLRQRGVPIQHIREDGRLDSYDDVEPPFKQQLLFGELEQDEWKSLQSVSPKSTLENSLED